ncbi:uncharacterized protein A1O5_02948 [Cladophialophora psammophila CBS 110553]|uniref:Cytochrome P450 n=1 Tax=Cladophialophora psammophila CBS 110553 TaxID=1182543 RepID=W9WYZ7_9EURO|nr:uncharacterized protein A1O5_02948 [Cladophialophora psammophila CBS 110553]EXJ73188.1 hypothetical protein A1O5_02948 [Cladophialophora psammophila CBS 110553]
MDQNNVVVTAISVLLGTCLIGLCINRIYFSPVAHIPGPLLAKISYWYVFYYDVVLRGQYAFKIKKLHEQYGPVVRINPAEVHFADPDFYDAIYAGPSQKRDKWSWFCRQFGIPDSTFATVGHDQHRLRRSALNPFFSKAKVRSLQPLIEDVARKLLARFEEFQMLGDPLTISLGFAALTNDIAEQYALGQNENRVLARDFDPSFHDASIVGSTMGHLTKQFPFILSLMQSLPDDLTIMMNRSMASYVKLQRDIRAQIELIHRHRESSVYKSSPHQTIFHEILESNLPEAEKSTSRLWQDGQVTVIAGTLTTASALSCTLFALLSQPELLRRLKLELAAAIPNPNRLPELTALEQLPFLTACIKEGLRLSNGVSTRLQRIDPDNPVVFVDRTKHRGKRYVLPPGTPLSMTAMLVHFDESVFPQPLSFAPDRWLHHADADSPAPALDKYLVPFSRGTRQCIGMNLAYAELYITLAMVFRVYGSPDVRMKGDRGYLELFETEWARDVEIVGDGVTPLNRKGSRGVRIKVK